MMRCHHVDPEPLMRFGERGQRAAPYAPGYRKHTNGVESAYHAQRTQRLLRDPRNHRRPEA
ncbi:MAG: hypothetical protein BWY79_00794 [Actinobacteria bacterium ADurb.Bin444]|nr:MAG: hypothetical protein BWY79_00794 [Actinobacteria bacterium ADurb.Bin444]